MHVHRVCTACACAPRVPRVHRVCTACAPHVHRMCSAPHVQYWYTACMLEEQGDDGAPLGVYYPTGGFTSWSNAPCA